GKELSFDSSDAENRYTRSLTYWDPQLLDSWQQLFVRAGTTEVGPFADLQLHRPFKTLADPFSYGVDYSGAEEDVFYYRGGDTTASIGRRRQSLRLFAAGASGPRELRTAVGLDCRLSTVDYGAALGADAPLYRVPGDTTAVELGPYVSIDYRPRFDKVQRLDALDYTEDVALGANCTLRLAGRYRDEVGAAAQLEPLLDLSLRLALQPLTDTYLTLAAGGTVRIDGDRLEGWRGSVALHAYQLSLPAQTLAGSLTFDVAGDREDLQPQLTLGEDNGLRGYPAREFEGRRFARLNLEDRIDTGLDILSVHLGLAAFFDVGWVQDPLLGRSMQDGNRAFGAGLRFGSSHLLGSRVLRLDVAKPLDEAQGQHFGISVSFGSGQVFSFFGNAQALDSSF
ncbi:MAG TPA: hypothetical protein VK348_14655, partial [Planctomycetota bacterium]|nr:hypothetical protein [Planctomycetota bacterium]